MNMQVTPNQAVEDMHTLLDQQRKAYRGMPMPTKKQRILDETHAGGVSINEVPLQAAIDSLPFGGIGNSGMGHYHGWEGFETMSKAKSVLKKGKLNGAKSVYAPYGRTFHKIFYWLNLR